MKAAENKTTTSSLQKKGQPFFDKGSGQSFFFDRTMDTSFFRKNQNKRPVIQPKLTIGQPNDKYEKEADAMADKVVQRLAMPDVLTKKETGVQTKPLAAIITPIVQTKCAACEQEEKLQKKDEEDLVQESPVGLQLKPIFESNAESPDHDLNVQRKCAECEKEEKLQTKPDASDSPTISSNLESSLNSSKSSGSLMPASTREQMESSFGADFSHVHLHTDNAAARMNKDLNAQAFTHGNDIYFNSGKYDFDSNSGRHLLAHELTHVVQQNSASRVLASVQKAGKPEKPENDPAGIPKGMACPVATSTPLSSSSLDVRFSKNNSNLTDAEKITIGDFINNWNALGATDHVRVDGYASVEGPPALNWKLSCNRALAVANELSNPQYGSVSIPAYLIEHYANGETNQFSEKNESDNRIATISSLQTVLYPPPQPPAPKPELEVPESDFDNEDCSTEDWNRKIVPADKLARKMTLNAINKIINTMLYINMERTKRWVQPQFDCVVRNGGCGLPGGVLMPEDYTKINNTCKDETGYDGPDLVPSSEECRDRRPARPSDAVPFTPLLQNYFKSATPDLLRIVDVYSTVYKKFVDGDYTLECEYDCDGDYGYVYGVWTDIHLCMNVINAGNWTEDCIARTILHEFTHYYAGTGDHGYCKDGCNFGTCPGSLTEDAALYNADSYACFAWELYQKGY